MKIRKIELCNFGSYAGINTFDLNQALSNEGKIVLIGGKNGAGKTTLFSGIKLCLYGHKAEGFNNVNAFYRREVKKFFNDLGKYETDFQCYVKVNCQLSNGQKDDFYEIKREWHIHSRLLEDFETVTIWKNGFLLSEDELADFDNFLLGIVPPDLFDLFFFDGEQIADYFLAAEGSQRVKDAFMVLCGFDTLDLMEQNFRRTLFGKKINSKTAESDYFELRERAKELNAELNIETELLSSLENESETIVAEINDLDKKYRLSGGVSYDEWEKMQRQLKEEESYREEKNGYLKKMANEQIPFIIVRKQLKALAAQLDAEHEKAQFELLQHSLRNLLPDIMARVYRRLEWKDDDELTEFVLEEFDSEIKEKNISKIEYILNLSNKEMLNLLRCIDTAIAFDEQLIIAAERDIEVSLQKTQNIRQNIEKSSIEGIEEYMTEKQTLLDKKCNIDLHIDEEVQKVALLTQKKEEIEALLKREEKKFEEAIKKQSVTDLAQKSIVFLEVLQERLFQNEIKKVQALFMQKVKILARKNNFIDAMNIDKDFNIHVYKRVEFNAAKVCEKIAELGTTKYAEEYGLTHCQGVLEATGTANLEEFVMKNTDNYSEFSILQEIDKSRLSKGEKQIFIMALYWSFMRLSKYEVPFIIDTPFARIDSEHRNNITKNFFMDLRGQVFIFSTNEEIIDEHYDMMKPDLQATFLLENSDNICTTITANKYFGGE